MARRIPRPANKPGIPANRCGTIRRMEFDDDPEKRIRELERGISNAAPVSPTWGYDPAFAASPRRTSARRPILIVVGLAILALLAVAAVVVVNQLNWSGGGSGPVTVAPGGTLGVGGNNQNETIVCNEGSVALSANNSTIKVVGHCASVKLSGFDSHVNIENADAVEVSGFDNAVTEAGCGDGKRTVSGYNDALSVAGHCASLTVSSYSNRVQADSVDIIAVNNYGNKFTLTGHCGSLKVSAYDNQVQVDSVDVVDVSGYSNAVTYHSGSPKITQSGYDIV